MKIPIDKWDEQSFTQPIADITIRDQFLDEPPQNQPLERLVDHLPSISDIIVGIFLMILLALLYVGC